MDMTTTQGTIGIAGLAVLIATYAWYVVLMKRRNAAQEALSGVDVQLKQRHDTVPNVVRLAQSFMSHEKDLLTRVTEARNRAEQPYSKTDPDAVKAHLKASGEVAAGLGRIFAVAEAYPNLESRALMKKAQDTVEEIEAHIAAARRFYNAAVTQLNNAAQIFPGSLVAALVRVRPLPHYETEAAARVDVNVQDYLKI